MGWRRKVEITLHKGALGLCDMHVRGVAMNTNVNERREACTLRLIWIVEQIQTIGETPASRGKTWMVERRDEGKA